MAEHLGSKQLATGVGRRGLTVEMVTVAGLPLALFRAWPGRLVGGRAGCGLRGHGDRRAARALAAPLAGDAFAGMHVGCVLLALGLVLAATADRVDPSGHAYVVPPVGSEALVGMAYVLKSDAGVDGNPRAVSAAPSCGSQLPGRFRGGH